MTIVGSVGLRFRSAIYVKNVGTLQKRMKKPIEDSMPHWSVVTLNAAMVRRRGWNRGGMDHRHNRRWSRDGAYGYPIHICS